MRALGTRAALALVAVGLTFTSACGDNGGDKGVAKDEPSADVSTPSCLATLTPVEIPSDGSFPADWAFPPGTIVTATEPVPGGNGLAVTAQVAQDFEEVLPFMQHDLEDAGFVATNGEAEEDDAEATWSGKGFSGTWAIRASDSCEGTTLLQVAAAKQ